MSNQQSKTKIYSVYSHRRQIFKLKKPSLLILDSFQQTDRKATKKTEQPAMEDSDALPVETQGVL